MESQLGTEPGPSFSLHPPRAREAARARCVFAFPALTVGRGGDHLWDRVSKAWKSPLAIPQFPLPPSWPQITPLTNHSVYWVSQKFCLGFSVTSYGKTQMNCLANPILGEMSGIWKMYSECYSSITFLGPEKEHRKYV